MVGGQEMRKSVKVAGKTQDCELVHCLDHHTPPQ